MSKKRVFLFDMDGTLTPPRKSIEQPVIEALLKLTKIGKVGVVTGSDYDYVIEQFGAALKILDKDKVDILPCNGTKKYVAENGKYSLEYQVDMIKTLGRDKYNAILFVCSQWQNVIMNRWPTLPYTGTFLQFRGSLLNWCPIGRSANHMQRKEWVECDNKHSIRKIYADVLESRIFDLGIAATEALGGATSVDVYPVGWDKTHAISHYRNDDVFFVGDKCQPGGNDFQIYKALKEKGRSFETANPSETCEIIKNFLEKYEE